MSAKAERGRAIGVPFAHDGAPPPPPPSPRVLSVRLSSSDVVLISTAYPCARRRGARPPPLPVVPRVSPPPSSFVVATRAPPARGSWYLLRQCQLKELPLASCLACAAYCASLVLCYGASTLYHSFFLLNPRQRYVLEVRASERASGEFSMWASPLAARQSCTPHNARRIPPRRLAASPLSLSAARPRGRARGARPLRDLRAHRGLLLALPHRALPPP